MQKWRSWRGRLFFCIILCVSGPELARLRSWIQEIGSLLPLSFFCHSEDDTWHSELT